MAIPKNRDLNDKRMFQPFVEQVRQAVDTANDLYFMGRLKVDEGYRTLERQAELKKLLGNNAANSGESFHNYGLAVDIWIADFDGSYSEDSKEYQIATNIFANFNLYYLRNKDMVHFQHPTTLDLVGLYKKLTIKKSHDFAIMTIHERLLVELNSINYVRNI